MMDFLQPRPRLWTPPPSFLAQRYLRDERRRRREQWRRIRDPRLRIDPLGCLAEINAVSGSSGASAVSSQATGSWASTTGNFIVVGVRSNSNRTFASVTDTAGNTFLSRPAWSVGFHTLQIWFAYNVTGNAANVVTATLAASTSDHVVVMAAEYSGVATTNAFDTDVGGNNGSGGSTLISQAFTTAQANELAFVIGATSADGFNFTAGSGFLIRATQDGSSAIQDRIFSAIQTGVMATFTLDFNATWTIIGATFKAAGGDVSDILMPAMLM